MPLRDIAAITGIGETKYCRNAGRSSVSLNVEAALAAIRDAGLQPKDIDGIIALTYGGIVAEDFMTNLGISDLRFSGACPLGGASAVAGLQSAAAMIKAGICRHVLLPAGRNGASGPRVTNIVAAIPQMKVLAEFERPLGVFGPAQFYAPMVRRHMELYGTTSRQLGEIAVTMRRHAMLSDNAIMQKPMTIEDHQASRMIADPLRALDCCIESDGAAAVVVSAADFARDAPNTRVLISGLAEAHPESPSIATQRADLTKLGTAKAAPRAFAMAGVTPSDIDLAELYDCFTYIVLCQLEDLGFCKKGEGGAFVEGGRISLGGALPVNTHGGLLSQAHVSGMNHIVELVRQLRGQGGKAQVKDAELGLVTGYGDFSDASIAIMRRG